MPVLLNIHPTNPQSRLLQKIIDALRKNAVIVYPTETSYAFGCLLNNKAGIDRIRALRQLTNKHHFTLLCANLAEVSNYGILENQAFRLLKSITPGPYTFILKAKKRTPNRLLQTKSKTIGFRISAHHVAKQLCELLGEPLLTSSLLLPESEHPLACPEEINDLLKGQVDWVINAGYCGVGETTVLNLVEGAPKLLRMGDGDINKINNLN